MKNELALNGNQKLQRVFRQLESAVKSVGNLIPRRAETYARKSYCFIKGDPFFDRFEGDLRDGEFLEDEKSLME